MSLCRLLKNQNQNSLFKKEELSCTIYVTAHATWREGKQEAPCPIQGFEALIINHFKLGSATKIELEYNRTRTVIK
jgi:hypothetical protein